MKYLSKIMMLGLFTGIIIGPTSWAIAAPQTESVCTIGMAKGEQGRSCEVPIPDGCTMAKVPGYDQPWADVSKGGGTQCQFDKTKTDWTSVITGTCGPCTTDNCSAQFIVKFNCAGNADYKAQPRTKH